MAIRIIQVNRFGSPVDDPGCDIPGLIYLPDETIWPMPWHCVCGTRAGGYTDGGLNNLTKPLTDLAEKGVMGIAFQCRLAPGHDPRGAPPGQTTDGTYPQQTDDCQMILALLRNSDFLGLGYGVTGFVGMVGGSGSAHHALYCALQGVLGSTKSDASICLSPPTDHSRTDVVNQQFIFKSQNYCACSPADDHDCLLSKSPISYDLANMSPVSQWNGTNENMGLEQLVGFRDAVLALPDGTKGKVGYDWHINDGSTIVPPNMAAVPATVHAFGQWNYMGPYGTQWMLDRIADWVAGGGGGGGGGEPPPPQGKQNRVTVAISGLSPGTAYNFAVEAKDTVTGLVTLAPLPSFDFVSDRAGTGGGGGGTVKTPPKGVYAQIDVINGVATGVLSDRDWWGFSYVDGARYDTTWAAVNPTSRNTFDWSFLDAFLQLCADNSKMGGISIDFGIRSPSWVFQGSNGAASFDVHGPNTGTLPVPWDAKYQQIIKNFIGVFATHFDTNPNLGYVVMGGLGQILDTILVQSQDYAALNSLAVAAGFASAIEAWQSAANSIMDVWVKLMKTTTCMLAIELPVPQVNGGLDGISDTVRAAVSRYKDRFGVMNLELDGLTAATDTPSLNQIIHDNTRSVRGYQFLWPSDNPSCDPGQEVDTYDGELGLRNAANAGIAIGVQFEEFKESDLLITDSPYPDDFTQFQTDLKANAI